MFIPTVVLAGEQSSFFETLVYIHFWQYVYMFYHISIFILNADSPYIHIYKQKSSKVHIICVNVCRGGFRGGATLFWTGLH